MLGFEPVLLLLIVLITLGAGVVKGVVGFALPMIMISGFASIMPAEQALAALILPTFITNLVQALRQGWRQAYASARQFRWLIGTTSICIVISAQLVPFVPQAVLLAALGVPVALFALIQLAGVPLRFPVRKRIRAEVITGVVGGLYGGMSGVWGPPTIALLVSLDTPKQDSVRVQGVVYVIGGGVLLGAHLGSGVLNAATLPLSALMIVPALAGLWLGFGLQDRLDATRFRHWTLIVLLISALNLVRRALMG